MCIPGAINNVNTEGIYKLLKDGATMVTTGEDILNTLGWEVQTREKFHENKVSKKYLPVYNIVSVEAKGFDEIQTETGMKTDELLVLLTEMELHGLIEQSDGDKYKRVN